MNFKEKSLVFKRKIYFPSHLFFMTKFTIEQGYTNPTLRTVSSTIANHDIRKYKKIADDMIKYIKNPKNG